MNTMRGRLGPLKEESDSGFTLIEVVVAIAIIAILATASLGVYVASLNSAAAMQRRQVAITVANESLESVAAWSVFTNPATGVINLFGGRREAAVKADWNKKLDVDGADETYAGWDPAATSTTPVAIPLSRSVTRNGTGYTADIMMGTCYQPITGGDCGLLNNASAAPGVARTPLIRVIVIVSWTAGDSCADGCTYQASTLLDANSDLEWNRHD